MLEQPNQRVSNALSEPELLYYHILWRRYLKVGHAHELAALWFLIQTFLMIIKDEKIVLKLIFAIPL